MGDYMDNKSNGNASWKVDKDKAIYHVDHGNHSHDLDVSKVPIEKMYNQTNQVLGDAHRASGHNKK